MRNLAVFMIDENRHLRTCTTCYTRYTSLDEHNSVTHAKKAALCMHISRVESFVKPVM